MTLPAPTTFGTVTGSFVVAVNDSGDLNTRPDSIPAVGNVTFVPSVPKVNENSATPPTVIILQPFSMQLDASGSFSVELVATDNANTDPTGFVYLVTCAFVGAAAPTTFPISVPGGTTTDITQLMD